MFLAKRMGGILCTLFFTTILILQIELVHAQFKRAKAQTEFADIQLDLDMAVAQKEDTCWYNNKHQFHAM